MFADFELTLGREILPKILKQIDLDDLTGGWSDEEITAALKKLRDWFGREKVDTAKAH
jgi:hypothetical protein